MTISTKLSAFPIEFIQLADDALRYTNAFELPFANEKEAKAFRMQWYGFLRALDYDAKGEEGVEDTTGYISYPKTRLAENARNFALTIHQGAQDGAYAVKFTPRGLTATGAAAERLLVVAARANPGVNTVLEVLSEE
jgi:hypothetical protein